VINYNIKFKKFHHTFIQLSYVIFVGIREIEKVLWFRNDISPFLVHLTRKTSTTNTAKKNLESILTTKELRYADNRISDAKFGISLDEITPEISKKYFSAVSFTETPLNEVHSLLDIAGRNIELKPYGLVFLKQKLMKKGVSPVVYINNFDGTKIKLIEALYTLTEAHSEQAKKILPYIAIFGKMLLPIGGTQGFRRSIDFTWEREWRYASDDLKFEFDYKDVFIGLCDDKDIETFETLTNGDIEFIDPQRNIKWYADKLVKARKKAKLPNSVV